MGPTAGAVMPSTSAGSCRTGALKRGRDALQHGGAGRLGPMRLRGGALPHSPPLRHLLRGPPGGWKRVHAGVQEVGSFQGLRGLRIGEGGGWITGSPPLARELFLPYFSLYPLSAPFSLSSMFPAASFSPPRPLIPRSLYSLHHTNSAPVVPPPPFPFPV